MKQNVWIAVFLLILCTLLAGCSGDEGGTQMLSPICFDNITVCEDIDTFIAEVDYADGSHNNEAKDVGMILSPYFSVRLNETEIPCYAVRTSLGAHSFVMLDAGTAATFPAELQVLCATDGKEVTVLPTTHGITPTAIDGGVSASIPGEGIYTFVIGDNKRQALTVFVRGYAPYTVPDGYEVIRVAPGVHDEKIFFTAEKQVLYFERGLHEMKYNIDFWDNTEVYLEPGAYIMATMPDHAEDPWMDPDWAGMTRWNALFQGDYVSNVRISGRGIIDLSRLDWHARSAVRFDSSDHITVDGVTLNNSPEWTLYFTQCQDIHVEEILLFGYRQNSDGICMTDCRNALTKNCFARSGDDLFEVKSMYGDCQIPIENIRFEGCQAWPDKARGLGIIAESQRDMRDIHITDCSVGFASAEWMDALGAVVVYLTGKAHVDDVSFANIELYHSAKYPINVTLESGSTAVIENVSFKNIDIRGGKPVRIANNSEAGEIRALWFDGCTRNGNAITDDGKLSVKLTNVDRGIIHINERSE